MRCEAYNGCDQRLTKQMATLMSEEPMIALRKRSTWQRSILMFALAEKKQSDTLANTLSAAKVAMSEYVAFECRGILILIVLCSLQKSLVAPAGTGPRIVM